MNDERWLHLFNDYANSSFVDALRRQSPHLLPGAEPRPATPEATVPTSGSRKAFSLVGSVMIAHIQVVRQLDRLIRVAGRPPGLGPSPADQIRLARVAPGTVLQESRHGAGGCRR